LPTKDEREPFYRVDVAEAKEMVKDPSVAVIDVRDPHEYQAGHVPEATLIPVNSVFARREELPKDGKILFVCKMGSRSALAAEMAAAARSASRHPSRRMRSNGPGRMRAVRVMNSP